MIMQAIILKDLPIPPSINQAYYTDFRSKTRHKSSAYRTYERMILEWARINPSRLMMARDLTTKIGQGQAIRVDCTFYFQRSEVLTKEKKQTKTKPGSPSYPKRNDTSNRIKIAHDELSKLLGLDDKYFWDGTFEKKILSGEHPGFLDITLSIIDIEGY